MLYFTGRMQFWVMSLIAMRNRVTKKAEPCGTPFSCVYSIDK